MSKRKKILLISIGIFIIILQVGTYLLFSSSSIPAIALRLAPGYKSFSKATNFSWVYLEVAKCDKLSENQKTRLLSLFKDRYGKVYEIESDIPPHLIERGSGGDWLGYNGGFSFRFSITSQGPFWVKVSHQDCEGNVGASSGEHVYIWILGMWRKLYDGSLEVS